MFLPWGLRLDPKGITVSLTTLFKFYTELYDETFKHKNNLEWKIKKKKKNLTKRLAI